MRSWIRFAANLYPRRWRQRYGEEFDALLDDVRPGWPEVADVTRGAMKMQMTTGATYLKLAAVLAVVGGLAAAAMSFRVPQRYVSSTLIRVAAKPVGEQPVSQAALDKYLAYQVENLEQAILSLGSLSEMISRPSLNLYEEERRHTPMQDIIEQMRRDIHVSLVPRHQPPVLNISFAYPDREKAQAVTRELVSKFIEESEAMYRQREAASKLVWQQSTPIRERIEVLDPPSLPREGSGPNRVLWIEWGLGGGLLAGLILASVLRRPKWSLQVGACAVVGGVLAYGISLRVPDRYHSSSVMRITPSLDPKELTSGGFVLAITPYVERLSSKILGPASLADIIQKGSVDLDPDQLRRNIAVRMVDSPIAISGTNSAFVVEFSHRDPAKAQAVTRALVSRFMEQNNIEMAAREKENAELARVNEYKAGENLEVIDPPSLPQAPIWPNRSLVTAAGLLSGLLLGPLVLWFLQYRRMQRLQLSPEGG